MRLSAQDPVRGMSPDEGAAYWRVRHDAGGMSAQEVAAFDAWRTGSAANARAWSRAEQVWDLFDVEADEHLQAMRSVALEARAPRRWRSPSRVAAALAGLAVSALLYLASGPAGLGPAVGLAAGTASHALASGHHYETARGERLNVTLADETILTLDTDTAVDVRFDRSRRSVHLRRGRALFDVAKDASRPFVVKAAEREVVAVGTVFDVSFHAATLKVLLVEGKVAVRGPATQTTMRSVVLHPGEELVERQGGTARIAVVDAEAAILWRDGMISLRDVTLEEAVAQLNRYTPRQMTVRDPAVGALRVSGLFRIGAPERFVNSIAEILPVAARPAPWGLDIVARPSVEEPLRIS